MANLTSSSAKEQFYYCRGEPRKIKAKKNCWYFYSYSSSLGVCVCVSMCAYTQRNPKTNKRYTQDANGYCSLTNENRYISIRMMFDVCAMVIIHSCWLCMYGHVRPGHNTSFTNFIDGVWGWDSGTGIFLKKNGDDLGSLAQKPSFCIFCMGDPHGASRGRRIHRWFESGKFKVVGPASFGRAETKPMNSSTPRKPPGPIKTLKKHNFWARERTWGIPKIFSIRKVPIPESSPNPNRWNQ